MKVECLLEKLKSAIGNIEKVSAKNVSLPILSTICIQTDERGLVFKATNLNIGAEIYIPAKVIEHGVVAVPAQLLAQICNGLSGDDSIILETVNDHIVLQTKNSKLILKSMNADDFPNLPKIESEESFTVPTDQFISGIRSVMYAAAVSDIKPEISSIFMYPDQDQLVFVSTDAFRLAEKKIPVKGIQQFPEILLPVKNITEIIRILGEYGGSLEIKVSENQIAFIHQSVYITSRLTGGNYPNYRQIIPKESKTEIIALKSDVQAVLKSIMVFSDKFNQIELSINKEGGTCLVSSHNQETGEAVVHLAAAISGESLETRMNHRYITDVLGSLTTDSVSFSFTEPQKPMIIRSVGDTSFMYLVMPMSRAS
jgi:DNA polymerase-3 subunit beta